MKKEPKKFFKGSGLFIGAAVCFVLNRVLGMNVILSIFVGSVVAILLQLVLEGGFKEKDSGGEKKSDVFQGKIKK
jgi:hypothetical protein